MSVEDIEHCLKKIEEIVNRGTDDRRSLLQLGYNLGRLSELTGLGREPFWDAWKGPVETWDGPSLLAQIEAVREAIARGFSER
ncbi:MAG TPA: hypothetical protein VFT74_06330 [Isosphaeraceae bacterium]|nr:hypothetical protein [Isosphaeraceae bacterium]